MDADLIHALQLGRVPRVVGTIITRDYLERWSNSPLPLPCDLVEFRVDGYPEFAEWLDIGKQIERKGTPVFGTVRLEKEGGLWRGGDSERWRLLEPAIRNLSGVDVEFRSELASAVSELCAQLGKLAVFSFHDFAATPPEADLEAILSGAVRLRGIGKVAATANSVGDVEVLRSLLRHKRELPVCVIGMGTHGRETRLQFPLEGSCFTYGYLDTPGAPGQYSAAELTSHFKEIRGSETA